MRLKPEFNMLYLVLLVIVTCQAGPVNRHASDDNYLSLDRRNETYDNEYVCFNDDLMYKVGDSMPSTKSCERCSCQPEGILCGMEICEQKPGCKAMLMPGQCCPQYQCECSRNGRVYQNGERLENPDNPCEVCYCRGGEVSCTTIECYRRDDCEPHFVRGLCCPIYNHCPVNDQPGLQPNRGNSDQDASNRVPQQRFDILDLDREASEGIIATLSIIPVSTELPSQDDKIATTEIPTSPSLNSEEETSNYTIILKAVQDEQEPKSEDLNAQSDTTELKVQQPTLTIENEDVMGTTVATVALDHKVNENADDMQNPKSEEPAQNAKETPEDAASNATTEYKDEADSQDSTAKVEEVTQNPIVLSEKKTQQETDESLTDNISVTENEIASATTEEPVQRILKDDRKSESKEDSSSNEEVFITEKEDIIPTTEGVVLHERKQNLQDKENTKTIEYMNELTTFEDVPMTTTMPEEVALVSKPALEDKNQSEITEANPVTDNGNNEHTALKVKTVSDGKVSEPTDDSSMLNDGPVTEKENTLEANSTTETKTEDPVFPKEDPNGPTEDVSVTTSGIPVVELRLVSGDVSFADNVATTEADNIEQGSGTESSELDNNASTEDGSGATNFETSSTEIYKDSISETITKFLRSTPSDSSESVEGSGLNEDNHQKHNTNSLLIEDKSKEGINLLWESTTEGITDSSSETVESNEVATESTLSTAYQNEMIEDSTGLYKRDSVTEDYQVDAITQHPTDSSNESISKESQEDSTTEKPSELSDDEEKSINDSPTEIIPKSNQMSDEDIQTTIFNENVFFTEPSVKFNNENEESLQTEMNTETHEHKENSPSTTESEVHSKERLTEYGLEADVTTISSTDGYEATTPLLKAWQENENPSSTEEITETQPESITTSDEYLNMENIQQAKIGTKTKNDIEQDKELEPMDTTPPTINVSEETVKQELLTEESAITIDEERKKEKSPEPEVVTLLNDQDDIPVFLIGSDLANHEMNVVVPTEPNEALKQEGLDNTEQQSSVHVDSLPHESLTREQLTDEIASVANDNNSTLIVSSTESAEHEPMLGDAPQSSSEDLPTTNSELSEKNALFKNEGLLSATVPDPSSTSIPLIAVQEDTNTQTSKTDLHSIQESMPEKDVNDSLNTEEPTTTQNGLEENNSEQPKNEFLLLNEALLNKSMPDSSTSEKLTTNESNDGEFMKENQMPEMSTSSPPTMDEKSDQDQTILTAIPDETTEIPQQLNDKQFINAKTNEESATLQTPEDVVDKAEKLKDSETSNHMSSSEDTTLPSLNEDGTAGYTDIAKVKILDKNIDVITEPTQDDATETTEAAPLENKNDSSPIQIIYANDQISDITDVPIRETLGNDTFISEEGPTDSGTSKAAIKSIDVLQDEAEHGVAKSNEMLMQVTDTTEINDYVTETETGTLPGNWLKASNESQDMESDKSKLDNNMSEAMTENTDTEHNTEVTNQSTSDESKVKSIPDEGMQSVTETNTESKKQDTPDNPTTLTGDDNVAQTTLKPVADTDGSSSTQLIDQAVSGSDVANVRVMDDNVSSESLVRKPKDFPILDDFYSSLIHHYNNHNGEGSTI